jgi:L-asparaginase/Glu-tRNA(Gln) amidotransferase subunit D
VSKPLIAVFAGPEATIENSPELRTGVLRPQRLARPVTVYVEQFSAHPLEGLDPDLCGPPDAYVGEDGTVREAAAEPTDRPAYAIELRPEDGLLLLPYVGVQASGEPWLSSLEADHPRRQTFYPDASRIYEEIDRFGVDDFGRSGLLSALADFQFVRAAPSGGYPTDPATLPESLFEHGGVRPEHAEVAEQDYFFYTHLHPTTDPTRADLARLTNTVQATLDGGGFAGAQWLEGSPTIEETLYWLHLLIDTRVPLVGHAAQRRRLTIGSDADRNILDGVRYITSQAWADPDGNDALGAVLVVDGLAFSARDVVKTAARPGNYTGANAAGAVLAVVDGQGPPEVLRIPVRRHTFTSQLRIPALPDHVEGLRPDGSRGRVRVKDGPRSLDPAAVPRVLIHKAAFYHRGDEDASSGLRADVAALLRDEPLAGVVIEGRNPYGAVDRQTTEAARDAVLRGLPVVLTGRGNTAARSSTDRERLFVTTDLPSVKARILLMAALLKLGSLPPPSDVGNPGSRELAAVAERLAAFQDIFDRS